MFLDSRFMKPVWLKSKPNNLNAKKSNPKNTISAQHLKDHIEMCGIYLYKIINHSRMNSNFDDGMKLADITPVHKKDDVTNI